MKQMKTDITEIEVNGTVYVPKNSIQQAATPLEGKPYVVIRSGQSGCHAGYLESEEGTTMTLVNSRRLWYWDGAASLSQLAMEGVAAPDNCKFACLLSRITVYGCCEKIEATEVAKASIEGVKEWKQ